MRKKILLIVALLHIAATGIWAAKIDLSKLANYTNYEAKNGDVITGSTNTCSITIAAGATVTLSGVNITGYVSCIQCKGSAIIILADGTENTLTSQNSPTPAIMAGGTGTTLTIKGKGILNATGSNNCAGIGCSRRKSCGNIIIEDFWYGMETMVYYSQNVNLLFSPNPGDVIIMKSPNTIVQGSCDD